MRAYDRYIKLLLYDLPHTGLMHRIAHAGKAGDGNGVHLTAERIGSRDDLLRRNILQNTSLDVECTAQAAHLYCRQRTDGVPSEQQRTDTTALTFHNGIGGKCGGQTHHDDLIRVRIMHSVQTLRNTAQQVLSGRKCLGFAQYLPRNGIHDHAVGVGTAGVNAQNYRHGSFLP